MRKGNLFVISGPSGAGKGTLVARLLSEVPDAWVSISVTTREPRAGEVHGKNYYFVDEDEFNRLVESGELLEWARYSQHCYGTPLKDVLDRMKRGCQVILEIDVQGAFQVREKMPEAKLVFIEPPSFKELEKRLRLRNTEEEDVILRRLEAAKVELSHKEEYHKLIVNDELEAAVRELVDYVNEHAEESRG